MMVESGFSSPRTDAFPAGLRVLVVDDDPTWSKILEKMLKKCFYEVTTCCLAREALNLLRERKDGYDIVISDVNMPDMDGFKLLEHVGLEMDLPVIMMSVDGETRRVMKGVQHGACDYLLKPIRMKELRNIWQHVFRKKIHELRDIESLEGIESFHMTTSGSDLFDDGHLLGGEDTTSRRKRKDSDNKYDDKDLNDQSTKKARVAWTVDLHQKFVKAVNQIGFDKVGPKKILDLMNVPWLTRENVASHLQKYRLYLSRLQKDGDIKSSFIGMKHSDSCSKSTASVDISSMNVVQDDVSFGFSVKNSLATNVDLKDHEVDRKGNNLVPIADPKRPLSIDIPDPRIAKSSRIGFDHFLGSVVNFTSFDSTNMTPYSYEPFQLENSFGQLPRFEVKPTYDEYRSNHVEHSSTTEAVGESRTLNSQVFEPISATTSSLKSQDIIQDPFTESEFSPRNMYEGVGVEDLQFCWLQGDCYAMNFGDQGFDYTEYNNQAMISETPFQFYDASKFDHEHLFDPTEYCPIDHGLFA